MREDGTKVNCVVTISELRIISWLECVQVFLETVFKGCPESEQGYYLLALQKS